MSSAFCFKGMKEKYKLTQVLSVFYLGFVGGGGIVRKDCLCAWHA